jgi:ESCRT-II complex subunit VPS25
MVSSKVHDHHRELSGKHCGARRTTSITTATHHFPFCPNPNKLKMASPSPDPQIIKSFVFPPHYSFPPFFTSQPNPTTRSSQLSSWRDLILNYCHHHLIFSLSPTTAATTALFSNKTLNRRLGIEEITIVLEWMSGEEGGRRCEWITPPKSKSQLVREKAWIYWKRPEEWATVLENWIDVTGQKGSVLTFWEIVEGDVSKGEGIFLSCLLVWKVDADQVQNFMAWTLNYYIRAYRSWSNVERHRSLVKMISWE